MNKKALIGLVISIVVFAVAITSVIYMGVMKSREPHVHTEVIDEAIEPTCSELGYTEGKHCSECGEIIVEQQPIEKLPHSEVIDKGTPATCTSTGLTEGKHCSICNEVIVPQQIIEKLPHSEVIDKGTPATCTSTGLTEGKHCSVCDTVIVAQTVVDKLPHTEVIDNAVAATCTTTGLTEGKHCSVCDTVIVSQTVVDKLPHTEVIDKAVAATCTTTGLTEGKHCSVCDTVIVSQTVVSAKGHTEVIDPAIAATCTSTGLTEGKHCSVCKTVIVAQTVTNKLPHTEVIDPAVAATCTTTGLTEGKHCSVCNRILVSQSTTEIISCIESDWITDKAPLLGVEGSKHTKCTMCSKVMSTETIPGLVASEGLEFDLSGESYVITGIGTCTDTVLVIPSSYLDKPVIEIADEAFKNCEFITSVIIPSSVNTIGASAFEGCVSLESVTLTTYTNTIGNDAFKGCNAITAVNYDGDVDNWNTIGLGNEYSDPTYYIGEDLSDVKLTNAEFLNQISSISTSDIDLTSLNAFNFILTVKEISSGTYTVNELHTLMTVIAPHDPDFTLFQLKQFYGTYLFDTFDNDGVSFEEMLTYLKNIAETREGNLIVNEDMKNEISGRYDGLMGFKEQMDSTVTKEEFTEFGKEKFGEGELVKRICGWLYDSIEKDENGEAKLVDILRQVDKFSLVIPKEERVMIENYIYVYDVIKEECAYDDFLPLIKHIVQKLNPDDVCTLDVDSIYAKQLYVMYFASKDIIPNKEINGADFLNYVFKVVQNDEAINKIYVGDNNNQFLTKADLDRVEAFLADTTERGYFEMLLNFNKLLRALDSKMPPEAISLEFVAKVYAEGGN